MITIRPVTLSDLEQYAALSGELFGAATNLARLETALAKIIGNPDYILVAAEDESGRLLGSVMGITCTDTVGECQPFIVLENLIVSEQARRWGIGKLLVGYVEEQAREKDCHFVMLMSLARRTEAHKFYESLGYSAAIARGYKKYL